MSDRFADQQIIFENGAEGETIRFESANPVNYADVLLENDYPKIELDGKLFMPPEPSQTPCPLVIVAPGSAGVAPSHLMHCETLTNHSIAAFVIDPFGARSVTSTVANQTQFSFAASAFDVLAALKVISKRPGIDPSRIGAQGHSRGGSAVMTAAMTAFQKHVLNDEKLKAVYAVYPWCGHQFLNPEIGETPTRIVIGAADEWCSPQQAQGYAQAIRLSGGNVSFRLFEGAEHSFDRMQPIEHIPDAKVAPNAPTVYLDETGAMIHPVSGQADPATTDYDLMLYAMQSGFGVTGAKWGAVGDQPKMFREDMLAFWEENLLRAIKEPNS